MALPRGWRETRNYWHRVLRPAVDFKRLRTKQLEGIEGVSMVGGPMKRGTLFYAAHEPGAFVPQSLRFKKDKWPALAAAVAWYEASRFPNPPREETGARNPGIESCECGKPGTEPVPIGGGWSLACKKCKRESIRSGETRPADWLAWKRTAFGPRRKNAPRRRGSMGLHVIQFPSGRWGFVGGVPIALAYEGDPVEIEKARQFGPGFAKVKTLSWATKEEALDAARAIGAETEMRGNPPMRQLRVGAFRAAADAAIDQLVGADQELGSLTAQAFEMAERGAPIPAWLRDRIRGLTLERKAQLEAVRVAVARHGSAIEEFHVPSAAAKGNRPNPPRGVAEARALYREFHGADPKGYKVKKIPDLTRLVHLGRALEVHYRAAVPRGAANTPYRHTFRSADLLAPPGGGALVILGPIQVSRAPRGRFGYIRG